MTKTILAAALAVLLVPLGCGEFVKTMDSVGKQIDSSVQGAMKKDAPNAPATPAPADTAAPAPSGKVPPKSTGKADFEGHYLSVWIDGKPTRRTDAKDLGERVWTVDACSATPVVKFQYDTGHLGVFREANVVINPVKGAASDPTDLWNEPRCRTQWKPGQDFRLGPFQHIAGGKLTPAAALPPGKYAFKVQVNGVRTWDRQVVFVTVK